MYWSEICGQLDPNGTLFQFQAVKGHNLSPCFQVLLQFGSSVLLFFTSICYFFYFFGHRKSIAHRHQPIVVISAFRMAMCLLIVVCTAISLYFWSTSMTGADDLGQALWWLRVLLYILALVTWSAMLFCVRFVFPKMKRTPVIPLICYLLCVSLFGLEFYSQLVGTSEIPLIQLMLYSLTSFCHISLLLLFIPSGVKPTAVFVSEEDLRQPLLGGIQGQSSTSYDTFDGITSLGSGERGGWFSRLFFLWVQPLMEKGKAKKVETANDVFTLPRRLETETVSSKFADNLKQVISEGKHKRILLVTLHRTFGPEYYLTGLLKFLADMLGFAGPLLLNLLITYMETSEPEWHGYLYAAGLFGSTFLASLCTTHFDYLVNSIVIKFRASLITSVYDKMLSVSTVRLSRFTSGQTTNFISTDVDRTVNFCPSFHQFWSLPFQVVVSLALLYLQVGWSLLAGLAFAVVLIPVNRQIAVKIGKLSTEMMEYKDQRVKTMNEMLYGMRVVKMLAWENFFLDRVDKLRSKELYTLKGRKYLDALCVYFWATTPVIISILTFATYSLLGNKLGPAKVFTSLALFNMLIGPLNAFPWVVNGLVEAWVSLKRVQKFLGLPSSSQLEHHVSDLPAGEIIIEDDAVYSWHENVPKDMDGSGAPQGGEITGSVSSGVLDPGASSSNNDVGNTNSRQRDAQGLKMNLNGGCGLHIVQGELVAVIGTVGSGKTSLLMSIIGEMLKVSERGVRLGAIERVGFVSQQAWIQQGTIKQNILLGQPYFHTRYERALACTALQLDVDALQNGDQTEVGENGVTLSGGQRARLTLARAVYQDCDLYLLDDPLAAVDAAVARHIYHQCIRGALREKTIILCTHHVQLLENVDKVVVMEHGEVVRVGTPEDILSNYHKHVEQVSHRSSKSRAESTSEETGNEEGEGAVIEEEKHSGTVSADVYKLYLRSVGTWLSVLILLSLLLMQASRNVSDWWLSQWVDHASQHPESFYLGVYAGLAVANTFLTLFRAFIFAYGGIQAARCVHSGLITVISRASMKFFDTTATGRIINRFSSDVYTVDDSLPFIANILLSQVFSIIGTVIVTIYGLPWFALVLVPLVALYYFIQGYYRHTSRELKRICSVTLSELYSHLSESVEGRVIIRAYRQTHRFHEVNLAKLDRNLAAQFSTVAASQWLNIRLQALGVAMVTAISFIAVLEHHFGAAGGVKPGLVGLAISYALSMTNLLSGVVSSFTETEKQMVSVERIDQYISGVETEDSHNFKQVLPSWPHQGKIIFANVSLQYSPSLPYVLSNIRMTIQAGEKVGIIGRTGSGKSSLFNLLFRLVDKFEGRVLVDSVDINNVELSILRSRIAIIPQTPFLFSGKLRDNLDPDHLYTDDKLWEVLAKCHLNEVVRQLDGGLDFELSERGRDFSMGQSQLVCLARALLRRCKILCIDEATANVDMKTDDLIQETISKEFIGCTVFTIAHRVTTIMHSNRVIVMTKGRISEFDSPKKLMENSKSYLSEMMKQN